MVKAHPWNTGFEWRAPAGTTGLTAAQAAEFDRDGLVVLPGILDRAQLDAMRVEIDGFEAPFAAALEAEGPRDDDMSSSGALSIVHHLAERSSILRAVTMTTSLLDVAGDVLGPDVDLYGDQAVYKRSERPQEFPIHQDTGYQFTVPQDFLSCWIPLSDVDEANGCLFFAPGLHRRGTLSHAHVGPEGWEQIEGDLGVDLRPVPMSAGDVAVFSSLTPHRTSANVSTEIRRAYLVMYARAGTDIHGDYTTNPTEELPEPTLPWPSSTKYPVLRDGSPVAGV